MRQIIVYRALLNAPLDTEADGIKIPVEFPATTSKAGHVADGAHGNLNETAGIDPRLRLYLGGGDTLENLG